MLTVEEIKMFIDEDTASVKKHFARVGERYFDGDHDIKNYRMFYFNSDGQLVEDTSRANVRIPHPFFKELTEQDSITMMILLMNCQKHLQTVRQKVLLICTL